jgi:hypothetical protein
MVTHNSHSRERTLGQGISAREVALQLVQNGRLAPDAI